MRVLARLGTQLFSCLKMDLSSQSSDQFVRSRRESRVSESSYAISQFRRDIETRHETSVANKLYSFPLSPNYLSGIQNEQDPCECPRGQTIVEYSLFQQNCQQEDQPPNRLVLWSMKKELTKQVKYPIPDFRQMKAKLNQSLRLVRECFSEQKESMNFRSHTETDKTKRDERHRQ